MAIFDPLEQRLCVRVVYDGVAGAGKTTNLRQLATLFAAQRATEVWSASEVAGRTLYFDWMQINAGVVAGIPLLCQIISVPGQVALTPRRRRLLETADVVVYVCDSDGSPAAIARAREGLEVLDAIVRERGGDLPIVIQANKQDQAGALDGARLVEVLGRPFASLIDAIATDGIGVVDTFVSAVRTLSRAMQTRSHERPLQIEVRRADTKEAAFAEIDALAIDPEAAAEMLLQEAAASLLLEDVAASVARDSVGPGGPDDRNAADGDDDSRTTWRPPAQPVLPHADVPTGFIWPAHTGRTILRTLAGTGALSTKPAMHDDGRIVHSACGWTLRTTTGQCFDSAEGAQQALVRAARHRTQLDQLLVPDTVVVAQASADATWWLWTVMPELPAFPAALAASRDDDERRALLDAYGVALVDAVRACLRHGFGLDLGPSSFGVDGRVLRFIGDTITAKPPSEMADAVIAAIAEIGVATSDTEVVLAAFERETQRRLTHEELASTASVVSTARAMSAAGAGGA